MTKKIIVAMAVILSAASLARAKDCVGLPTHDQLKKVLTEARRQNNGGLNLDMWGTIVDRSGVVCAVAYTGEAVDSQWPGSRVISAQKAYTANAFSLKALALSTANLYSAVQPGGSLFGLQESNPVHAEEAYDGDAKRFGSGKDPMVGHRIGGVNVFGGGLALYDGTGEIIGGMGVSGDTSCADHVIAWKARNALKLDFVPAGVSPDKNDNIIFDLSNGKSAGGYGHPTCGAKDVETLKGLPGTRTLKK